MDDEVAAGGVSNSASMAVVVVSLRNALSQARSDVATLGNRVAGWFNVNQVKAAADASLNTYSTLVDRLEGQQADMVLAGTMTPAKWESVARDIHAGIQYTVKTTNEWPLGRIVWEAASATVEDVKDVAKVGLPALGLAAAAFGALYLWRLLPQKRRSES